MKFLCRNCKAKYQIADEKVSGRTLRMSCQQCGEQIVVRGPGRSTGQTSRPISGPLAAQLSPPSAAPSALGVDFQRQVAAPAIEAATRAHDEWHVAINDVPVGPMRREEVARKIAAGAVDRESLAWREGMDDWMPVKHIPELAVLIAAPVAAGVTGGVPSSQRPPPAPPAPVVPAARVEMAPIGGRQVLTLDDYAPPPQVIAPAPAVVSQVAAEPAAAGKPIGSAQMFLLVAGGAFIMMAGAVLGVKFLAPPQAPVAAPAAVAAVAPTPAPATPQPTAADDEGSNVVQLDTQDINGAKGTTGTKRTGAAPAATAKPAGKQLTEEQKAMLARMGGGLDQGGGPNLKANLDTPKASSSGGGGGDLTAEQLSAVVMRGRKNLQRCYETALRGAQSEETLKLTVDIQVSPGGNVTSVHTSGKSLPGMDECITRTVKMWRFPTSGDGAQTQFPVVFQPGAG